MNVRQPDTDALPSIDTPRLRLRWLTAADARSVYRVFSDPQVTRYWSWPAFQSEGDAEELIARIQRHFRDRDLFQWGIAMRADDDVIGTCTLAAIEWRHRRAEIGFALNREFWGRGYAAEAVRALLEHAFGTLGLHRVEADVDPRNDRSLHLLERCGFVREGYLRERYHLHGEVQDSVIYGLLAEDFRAR